MAPLYSASPVIPEQKEPDDVSQKLTSEVADRTLTLIEEIAESFKAPAKRKERKSRSKRHPVKDCCMKVSVPVFKILVFFALCAAAGATFLSDLSECAPQSGHFTWLARSLACVMPARGGRAERPHRRTYTILRKIFEYYALGNDDVCAS
jgi:hypothetical protein